MILLTGFYVDPDDARQSELVECLRRNIANESIGEVHVFVEDAVDISRLTASYPPLAAPKVRLVAHGRRLTYRELFAYANERMPGGQVIIANADIFFDHTLSRLEGYELSGQLLTLSRWDVQADGTAGLFDFPASQDAWIFQAPIAPFFCDFHLGVPGCDNRLAWEADRAGLAVSNPSRSLRAHHLHLSGVRRYTERERLSGPTRAVPATFLGTPWLWFVVPCWRRLDDLRTTIGSLIAQPRSSYVLVDYSCHEGSGDWVRTRHPTATVVTVARQARFHGAHARNQGAAAVDEDGILCFLDADVAATPDLSLEALSRFEEGTFLVPAGKGAGLDTALVCSKASFTHVGGFDEAFLGSGEEVADLRNALREAGLTERCFRAATLSHCRRQHAEDVRFGFLPERDTTLAVHAAYRRAKSAVFRETGGNGISAASLREIYQAVARRCLAEAVRGRDVPCAAVTFRESMGYTVEQLKPGVSSHNNDLRPFAAVPTPLAGRQFTQVVSCSVSPVDVEFLSAGKLYVLVGTDWAGYRPATAWLKGVGQPEPMPRVETRRGTAFEVWSLLGEAGDRVVIPTQVMLVAERLERR
jgi:hypothetical protein